MKYLKVFEMYGMEGDLIKQVEQHFNTTLINFGKYYYFQGKNLLPIEGGRGSKKYQILDLGFKVDGDKIIAFVGKDENSSPYNDKLSIDMGDTGVMDKLIGFFDKWSDNFLG
jgi:hypothetical protein